MNDGAFRYWEGLPGLDLTEQSPCGPVFENRLVALECARRVLGIGFTLREMESHQRRLEDLADRFFEYFQDVEDETEGYQRRLAVAMVCRTAKAMVHTRDILAAARIIIKYVNMPAPVRKPDRLAS